MTHRETFYVAGTYTDDAATRVMLGQMFVEALTPAHVTQNYPLVFIHGGGQTAVNWLTTPDGREGWAGWFADQGWKVYTVDQAARGRSAWQPGIHGTPKMAPAGMIERYFTAPAQHGAWPEAKLHTQWPGEGRAGDPVFDQFYASQVAYLDNAESEPLMRAAGAALLDRIGPAILIVHSQGGLFGWQIADARPKLVKGIVAIEPSGPPVANITSPDVPGLAYGLTATPLTYAPPVTPEDPLRFSRQTAPGAPDLMPCWMQEGQPRHLVNLAGIPTLVLTSEASYHAPYDHCTVNYLAAAGVPATHIRLAELGIRGNGHMMMLEKNNLDIAALIERWMVANMLR